LPIDALERLGRNFWLKIFALALAVAAWAYLRLTPNPIIAARFVQQFSVPITTTGLGSDRLASFTEKQAVVSVIVPRGGAPIRPDEIRAVLDLEGRAPGVYNVPIQVIAPKLDIKSLSPASVTLSIERVEERSLRVGFHYVGDAHRGVVVSRVAVDPAVATLHGPSSDLARVSNVRIDVVLPPVPKALDAMQRPIATDERGNEVPNVVISPDLVRVRADFVSAQIKS
jgi:hypothetical protein